MQPKMQFAVPVFMGRNLTARPTKSKGRRSAPPSEVFARLLRRCGGRRVRSRRSGRRRGGGHGGGNFGAGKTGGQALAGGFGYLVVAAVGGVGLVGTLAA